MSGRSAGNDRPPNESTQPTGPETLPRHRVTRDDRFREARRMVGEAQEKDGKVVRPIIACYHRTARTLWRPRETQPGQQINTVSVYERNEIVDLMSDASE